MTDVKKKTLRITIAFKQFLDGKYTCSTALKARRSVDYRFRFIKFYRDNRSAWFRSVDLRENKPESTRKQTGLSQDLGGGGSKHKICTVAHKITVSGTNLYLVTKDKK